jgi:rubrerythrin
MVGEVMSLNNKRINYFKKDEKMAVKEYKQAAEQATSEAAKEMFMSMSADEARHYKMLDKIKKKEAESKKKKKSRLGRFGRKEKYEDKVKDYFEKEGVYQEQDAEDDVSVDRPDLPDENEWNEEYEEED